MNSHWISRCRLLVAAGFAVLAAGMPDTRANQNIRGWQTADGKRFQAEIISVDESQKSVVLRRDNGVEAVFRAEEFSSIDRAWLLEWTELAEELGAMVGKLGGRMVSHEGKGARYTTPFHIYHPSGRHGAGEKTPLLVLFDPGGHAKRYLLRHMEAAETANMTIVACEVFKNHMDEKESNARFAELFPIISEAVPHDEKRRFMGGTSGGSWRAFNLSNEFPQWKWAGIYSNCGWLGGAKNIRDSYPAMRVVMVNGDKDRGANRWADSDAEVLKRHQCEIAVMAFEGGHQIPPASVQIKAFKWLLGEMP